MQLYAIDINEGFETPIYAFGENHIRAIANLLNKSGCQYTYIAKIRIMNNGAFKYYDVDRL